MEIKRHRYNAVKISAIVLLTFFVFSESWAQAIQTYRAKRHDTIESVAEKFGVTVEELLECNKSYRTKKLRARDVLVLPPKKSAREQRQKAREEARAVPEETAVEEKVPEPVGFSQHVVAPKETVYGISHQWGITQDMLKEYNPELKTSVLKIGMVLKIPVLKMEDKTMEPAPETSVFQPDTVNVPMVRETAGRWQQASALDVKRMLSVDMILPFYLDRADSLVAATPRERLRDSRIALSFYMGALMALDSLAGQGLMADVRVFDSQKDVKATEKILAENDFSRTDLIIGPLFTEIAEVVASGMKGTKTLVVSPFSVKHDVNRMPNMVQASTPAQGMESAVLSYMADNISPSSHVIVIASAMQQEAQIARIRKRLSEKVKYTSIELLNTDLGNNSDRLASMVKQNVPTVILIPELSQSFMSEILQGMEQSARIGDTDIFAFEIADRAKAMMGEMKPEVASRLRFIYPDRLFENGQGYRYSDFENGFRTRYRELPNAYAYEGFNLVYDLLSRMATDTDTEHALTSRSTEQVGSRYRYMKYHSGGYANTELFILMYSSWKGEVLLY